MKYVKVIIKKSQNKRIQNYGHFFEYLEYWVRSLQHNGQVLESFENYSKELRDGAEVSVFLVPSSRSLMRGVNNEHVNRWKNKIGAEFGIVFRFVSISNYFDESIIFSTNLSKIKSLILKWDAPSPLRDIRTEDLVPLYFLPKTSEDGSSYQDIYYWKRNFAAVHELWMRDQILEEHCKQQLININSNLNKQGLSIASKISKLINRKVYYYLYSIKTESVLEKCPKCKKAWKRANGASNFDYMCENCLIIW